MVSIKNISKNQILNYENVSVKRPGPNKDEIPAKFFSKILGKKTKTKISNNKKIKWHQII